jgi:RHS repeat-associated protein
LSPRCAVSCPLAKTATVTAGTKSYQYDLAGRTAQVTSPSGVTSVTYDDEDRVTRVYNQSQSINQSYRYNGLDTRVQRLDFNAVTRTYRRDGVSPTAPVLGDGTATFTPGISERRGGVSKFLHQDYLGSTKQITGSNQAVTDTRQYDAFGLQTGTTGSTPTPFGFAGGWGYQQDSTGLQLLGHRYYDPSTGRFLTRDPIKDGRNWYGYCDNRASVAIDPEGLNDQLAKVHGNTAGSQQAVLYARYNKNGQFLKWGVTQYVENPNMRYRKFELDGGYCEPVLFGPRNQLLKIEKDLESRMPGVLNNTKKAVRTKNLFGATTTQNALRTSSKLRGLSKAGAFLGKGFAFLNLYQTGKNLYKAMNSKSCIIDCYGNVYDSNDPEYWDYINAMGWGA